MRAVTFVLLLLLVSQSSVHTGLVEAAMAAVQNAGLSASSPTPFTDFVLARIPDEEIQKLFALSFGEHLKRDPDALEIDFDDIYRWQEIDRKDNALRLLKREFSTNEYIVLLKEDKSAPGARASKRRL